MSYITRITIPLIGLITAGAVVYYLISSQQAHSLQEGEEKNEGVRELKDVIGREERNIIDKAPTYNDSIPVIEEVKERGEAPVSDKDVNEIPNRPRGGKRVTVNATMPDDDRYSLCIYVK